MGHGAPTRRTALKAALAAAVLTAGCTRHGPSDDARAPHGGRTPDGRTTAPTGSVLAVKIDNVGAARPQTGLDSADVVYAEQVEGGLSRLMAVYATRLPAVVGPVRSARESDLELLRQFDRPTLAFSGAQRKLLPLIDRAPLRPETPDTASGAYYRDSGRPAPHNLYLRPARLMSGAPGEAALTTGFRHGPAPAGGTVTTTRTVRYPVARFTFTWSAARQCWLVSMDGTPARTTAGRRVTAATVVVQHVRIRTSEYHDVLGNYTPFTETVGTGRAEVLRDGRSFEATWTRREATDATTFTGADGAPVDFAAGQVWVVFAKS
ncbi:DUF3048 domain-containing protein [Streptomyces sp. NPDC059224]|uniref:DUF3048 domain-containing protein n=1 Tax=Streptomyces sp. NPDC059224 TaxID=3346775 RepID=UPI00367AD09B